MLVVKIELWPHGDRSLSRTLGTAEIANDGTGTVTRGNYTAKFFSGSARRLFKTGVIRGFARKRLNAWYLLAFSLANALTGEEFSEVEDDHEAAA